MSGQVLILFLASFAFPAAGFADDVPVAVQQQIQPLLDEMAKAANAHDTDRFLAFYLHQPTLVFVINGQMLHGWEALRRKQLEWWQGGKSDAVYTQPEPTEYESLGPGVEMTTRSLDSRRTLPDGKTSTGHFIVTDIWRRLPEGWRIVYTHESWER